MTPHDLLSAFETLADAPDGVKRLRELVLQLAVRGKLVPQDPADESATDLLARIARDMANGGGRRRAARRTPGTSTSVVVHRFDVPPGWTWCSAEACTSYIRRGKSPSYDEAGQTPVVSQKCVQWAGFDISRVRFVADDSVTKYESDQFLRAGDLLWNSTGLGTLGRITPFVSSPSHDRVVADSHVTIVRPHRCDSRYLWCWFAGPLVQGIIDDLSTGSTKQTELATKTIESLPVPLPPLAEQHRIVARVDELMALLDRLEAAQSARDEVRVSARDAALAALRDAKDADEVEVAWGRVAEQMETLFSSPEDVAGLRETCVALAVRGRMTGQDNASSNGASALLSRCSRAKAVLVRSGRARREKPLPSLSDRSVPAGWAQAYLRDVAVVFDPNPSHRYPAYASSGVPLLSTREFDGANGWNLRTAPFVNEDFWRFQNELCDFQPSDIVFARKGRLGLARSMPPVSQFTFSHTVFAVKPLADVDPAYLLWVLRQGDVVTWLLAEMSDNTGVPTLGKAVLERLPVVVPPVDEQRRIVRRVQATVALCDDLEARLTAARDLQGQFAAAAVHHLEV